MFTVQHSMGWARNNICKKKDLLIFDERFIVAM